jgi:hypothetical protein
LWNGRKHVYLVTVLFAQSGGLNPLRDVRRRAIARKIPVINVKKYPPVIPFSLENRLPIFIYPAT